MTRLIVLAVDEDGGSCRCFATEPQHDPEKVARLIEKEATVHGLNVTAVVVPAEWATAENIAAFLGECWAEKHATPSLPEPPATLFPPPNAYSRKC